MEIQEKILRVVEYGSFERVGSSSPIEVNARIISATNADLAARCETGRFMPDLLDRLSFEVLFLPPLRNRIGDIPVLAEHFAREMGRELKMTETPKFSTEALALLEAHPWRGNIRELKNVVERAVYRSNHHTIRDVVFNPFSSPHGNLPDRPDPKDRKKKDISGSEDIFPDFTAMPLKSAVSTLEKILLERALAMSKHNQRRAATMLGLSYDQIRGLIRKHQP
jgi:psp operon transcriptional activator